MPPSARLSVEALCCRILPAALPTPAHVVVVIEENHSYSQIRGNPAAPFLNALAARPDAAVFTNSFAIEHPSQPNYLDLFSGSNQGVVSNATPTGPFTTPNLGASLLAAGRTFVGYSEDLPAAGSQVDSAGGYRRKHNPWVNWQGAATNGLPAEVNQPFSAFPTDYSTLPTVAFVVPSQANDMHDGTVAQADAWLKDKFAGYADWARTHNSLLVVTFDEDDGSEGNRILTVVAGQGVRGGESAEKVNHFGLLRTLEDMYGLPPAGASASAAPITSIWTVPTVPPPIGPPVPRLLGDRQFAAGDTAGGTVTLFNADASPRFTVSPFAGFEGSIRTATADFNADGVADLIAGTGPGAATRVRVLDGVDGRELFAVSPFEATFIGGVYVAAGDLNGDGVADLVITPDEGGGPRVDIYSGRGFGKFASFFGIDDPNFRGGARAATGDVNGDGVGDLVVSAGFGGGPRVATFDGRTLTGGSPGRLFGDFFAFEQTLRNGTFVAVGDLDGDGRADLVFGGGPGGGPRVTGYSAAELIASGGGNLTPLINFFAGDPSRRNGVPVAVKDLDNDDRADLVVGTGPGDGSRVIGYRGRTAAVGKLPEELFSFDAFPSRIDGVYVG